MKRKLTTLALLGGAADAGRDQQHVGGGAQQHDLADVRAHDALAQQEGVLRADGDDQRGAERGAVGEGNPVHGKEGQ